MVALLEYCYIPNLFIHSLPGGQGPPNEFLLNSSGPIFLLHEKLLLHRKCISLYRMARLLYLIYIDRILIPCLIRWSQCSTAKTNLHDICLNIIWFCLFKREKKGRLGPFVRRPDLWSNELEGILLLFEPQSSEKLTSSHFGWIALSSPLDLNPNFLWKGRSIGCVVVVVVVSHFVM